MIHHNRITLAISSFELLGSSIWERTEDVSVAVPIEFDDSAAAVVALSLAVSSFE